MKRVKRCIAVILSLAIIMTGIYWCENPAEEVQAATETEVNSEMLELKFQRGQGSISNKIRVVASVDNPNYSAVGFGIDKGDGNGEQLFTINTKTHPLPQRIKSTVYNIDGTEMRMDYSFSPKVIDTSSEYFLTAKWNAVEGTQYTVRAWVKTFDGDMIFGQSRCITLDDLSTTEYLNMSFELKAGCELPKLTEDETKYADIDVTYNGTSTTAEVISVKVDENGAQTVHVNVKNVNRTALPSVTEFVFGEYGSSSFRNLYTSYTETTVDEVTTDTADTSWYNTTDDEFVIATSADLYGLAQIVNGTATDIAADTFADKTIYVVSDIEANKGQSTTSGWITTKDADGKAITDGTNFQWTPIGKTTPFAGTFEGNMHTISGIYAKQSTALLGLFGATAQRSRIENLKLKNSYFQNDSGDVKANSVSIVNQGTGSIVGLLEGNLVNVYSNAYVKAKNYSGGMVGRITTQSADTLHITQCWFDGYFQANGGYRNGGIVGDIYSGTIEMSDCLNTGSVDCGGSKTMRGGLCGRVRPDNGAIDFSITNCLNYGEIKRVTDNTSDSSVRTGSIVGDIGRAKSGSSLKVTIQSVYATNSCLEREEPYPGIGYIENVTYNEAGNTTNCITGKIERSDNITAIIDALNSPNSSIWGIADDGTPMLHMTPVVTE